MNNINLLGELHAYAASLDEHERKFITGQMERDEVFTKPSMSIVHLANAMVELQRKIRAENNKKAGRGSWERLAKRMEKTTQREEMAGIIQAGAAQYLCDGFRAVKLPAPIEYKKAEQEFDIAKIMDGARHNAQPLDLPKPGEVKAHIALEKARRKAEGKRASKAAIEWDFGAGLPLVNAEYLLDMLDVMPEAAATWAQLTAPIYLTDSTTEAVLIPMRRKDATA